MGQIASRRQNARQEEDRSPAHFYKFPAKTGAYFASHFLMGGERFESSAPEAYLFGDNPDLNFLGARPVPFPYPQPQSTEPTRTLQCFVNIRRDSLKFVKLHPVGSSLSRDVSGSCLSDSECPSTSGEIVPGADLSEITPQLCDNLTDPQDTNIPTQPDDQTETKEDSEKKENVKYNIEFTFDSDYPCSVTVHFFAVESCSNSGLRYKSRKAEMEPRTYYFKAGANQIFSQPELIFDPCAFTTEELRYHPDSDIFPVVIHCMSQESDEGDGGGTGESQSHSTLAVVEKSAEGHGFILKPLKQKLFVDGVCYLLQEIYGIENKNVTCSDADSKTSMSHEDSDENGADCVVCMSELRDTLILPCRHLCLCNACAETLRYKASNCPICRSPFRALLQIKTLRRLKSTTSAPLLSSASLSAGNRTSKFRVDPGGETVEPVSPPLQGTFLTTRYETIPLIEALNGPVDHTQTCVTLPSASIPVSHSAPAISVIGRSPPRAPPRIAGRQKKKHPKPVVPIQEVLTPQAIAGGCASAGEKTYCDAKVGSSVSGLEIPTLSEEAEFEEETGSPTTSRVSKVSVIEEEGREGFSNPSSETEDLEDCRVIPGVHFLNSASTSAINGTGQDETPRSSVSAASLSSTKPLLPSADSPRAQDAAQC